MNAAAMHDDSAPASPSLLYRLRYTPLRDLVRGRLTARLDLGGEIARAELPEALGEMTRQVVRRTGLTRLERVEVARELIAHFQDGLAAGASAGDLAASFGDAKMAGRLIRRARLRGRPLAWRVTRGALRVVEWGILALVAVYLVQAVRIYSASVNVSRNYLAEWTAAAKAIPESEWAWPLYREGALATSKWPAECKDTDWEPSGARWEEVKAFAAENARALELYREAAARPNLGVVVWNPADVDTEVLYRHQPDRRPEAVEVKRDENPWFFSVLVPPLEVLREAARLLTIDAHAAAEAGDSARALADTHALLGLGKQTFQPHLIYSDLLAVGIASKACRGIGKLVHEYPSVFSDGELTDLCHRLSALGQNGQFRVTLASERAAFEDILQRCYTDDGHGDGLPGATLLQMVDSMSNPGWDIDGKLAAVIAPAVSLVAAGRRDMAAKYDSLMAEWDAEANGPLWQRGPSSAAAELTRLASSPVERLQYLPLVMLMPDFTQAELMGEYVTQTRDATLVGLALELFHRRHGTWPASLAELTPQFLPQVPLDRYDGKPIKYRVVNGEPVVYSVGVDRKDDGGRSPSGVGGNRRARRWLPAEAALRTQGEKVADGDWILWPPVKAGDD